MLALFGKEKAISADRAKPDTPEADKPKNTDGLTFLPVQFRGSSQLPSPLFPIDAEPKLSLNTSLQSTL
jgi:hypothetical protein